MVQLKVMVVNASLAEVLNLEEALRRAGLLERMHNMGLGQILEQPPDWAGCDLVIARDQAETRGVLLSRLAPVLRAQTPPVFFLVDPYEATLVNQLMDYGARRVFPAKGYQTMLDSALESLFPLRESPEPARLVGAADGQSSPQQKGSSHEEEGIPALFAHSPIGICILRLPDGVCLDCNESFARLLDWTRADLLGKPVLELELPAEFSTRAWTENENQSQAIEFVRKLMTREKQARTVQVHLERIAWRGQECAVGLIQDITEKERDKDFSRQLSQTLRETSESAHVFIFMISKDGLMEYANEYACRVLGKDPSKVEGMPASQFFPGEFTINHLQKFSEVREFGRAVYTEGPFYQGEEQFWMSTWLAPVQDDSGHLASVLGISRDITEQKKADESLQRALQKERKLGQFRNNYLSMTFHQLRTPLSTIMLSAGMLQKYSSKMNENQRNEQLNHIQEAATRLNNLLEDILSIGQVESARYACNPKNFDLVSFIEQVIAELSVNDLGKHTLVFQHQAEQFMVWLDPEALHHVLDNLLSNAIKYSPEKSQITTTLTVEEAYFYLEVSDQGIGIPEDDLQYLFQPFQRGSNAADYPGTGIGLTIIQQAVEIMNGSVSVKSAVGKGTTFTVKLPSRLDSEAVLAAS